MLENWIKPVDIKSLGELKDLPLHTLYHHIEIHHDKMPNLKDVPIVILGIGENANSIRKSLYALSWHFSKLKCVDLGNVRKDDPHFITQILTELIDGNILPIIIGHKEIQPIPQFLAHKGLRTYTNVAFISEQVRYNELPTSKDYINELLDKYYHHIFNLGVLGFQSHFMSPNTIEWLNKSKFDGIRLGELKSDIQSAEPIIRDADMMLFHLDALKGSECAAMTSLSPNGLVTEEACQLAKYAGMSNKLSSFSISGYFAELDHNQLTAQLIAQIIWYFIDGFQNRKGDYPFDDSDMTEYIVSQKELNHQITFWKSNKSNRWWIQIPEIKEGKDMKRHRLVPCSYMDYKKTSQGEIPERIHQIIERFNS